MNEQVLRESAGPMVLSVKEVCHLLRIGRTTFYKLIHAEELVARKIRGRTVVSHDDLAQFLRTVRRVGRDS
jgi:excisionase family DNA binding protein